MEKNIKWWCFGKEATTRVVVFLLGCAKSGPDKGGEEGATTWVVDTMKVVGGHSDDF